MGIHHYAIFDDDDVTHAPRNLFLVIREPGVLVLAIYDRAAKRWVEHPALLEYLEGEKADRCLPIDAATAAKLAARFGTRLPDADALTALPPAD
ncbi:MAG: hypothetical protein ACR2GX_07180 [Candidatus Dormibacteria bacterium]